MLFSTTFHIIQQYGNILKGIKKRFFHTVIHKIKNLNCANKKSEHGDISLNKAFIPLNKAYI